MKIKPIISGILFVSGLCMAGASAPGLQTQAIINGGGIITLGAGCLVMMGLREK